jgi:toxin CcdB
VARFDVHRIANIRGYFLDIQADFLGHLDTRVVVPLLLPDSAPRAAKRLNPSFDIDDAEVVMMTEFMAAIPKSSLQPAIGNLGEHRDEIVAAIDFLMQGF